MISRTPTLAEWPYRMVRLACLCPRRGQYRKDTLIASGKWSGGRPKIVATARDGF
jgi:hypothetical protein